MRTNKRTQTELSASQKGNTPKKKLMGFGPEKSLGLGTLVMRGLGPDLYKPVAHLWAYGPEANLVHVQNNNR